MYLKFINLMINISTKVIELILKQMFLKELKTHFNEAQCTSLKRFKQLHKQKYNQAVHFSHKCNNYAFVENLYKFILVQKNSFYI